MTMTTSITLRLSTIITETTDPGKTQLSHALEAPSAFVAHRATKRSERQGYHHRGERSTTPLRRS
jgi:hypothetical protein